MNMRRHLTTMAFCFLILTGTLTEVAFADPVYVFVMEKQKAKNPKKWTLQEWLSTKEKMRLMDMWLALHTPSPFEFFIGGDFQIASKGGHKNGWRATAAAYASLVGLEGEYESVNAHYLGTFNLRLFGYAYQASNLTFRVGLRSEERGASTYRNVVLGGNLTFYFMKFFGTEALYHTYFNSFSAPAGESLDGQRFEVSVFIDFAFCRVFGAYRGENDKQTVSGVVAKTYRSTYLIGTRLFF